MKTQIIIFAILFASATARIVKLTASTSCSCAELTQQADCSSLGCAWVTVNGSSSCSAATVSSTTTCTGYTAQDTCDSKSGCAWTNAGACAAFTKCSDYTIASTANANQCYAKNQTCIPGTASGTTVPCVEGKATCTSVTDQNVCSGLISGDTSICYWTTTCVSQDVSKCSTITAEGLCTMLGCTFANSKCAAPTCASITVQASCTYIQADAMGSHQICAWANNACADAADTTTLTATNCMSSTGKMYKWNGTSCVACTGSSSNAYLLALFALLALLF